MGKQITIGAFDFTLEKPSADTYDAHIDISRQDKDKGRTVLLATCISSPSQPEMTRIFAAKPAIKRKLIDQLLEMAGVGPNYRRLEADPERPNLVRYIIGDLVVAFRPATEAEYDAFWDAAGRSVSDASLVIVQQCVVEPPNIALLFAETPALKHGIASLIADEAGIGLEVIEKKQEPPSEAS